MTGAQQLKAALERKRDKIEKRPPVPIPDPIVFATAGTYLARDGKSYTITYE